MSSGFFKAFCFLFFLIIFIIIFSVPFLCTDSTLLISSLNSISSPNNSNAFIWPTPGVTKINSYFGKRISPTNGASSYHKGIDIAASTDTNILAVLSGIVTTASFSGSGGCTITIKSEEYTISYCHVSPNFIVHVGQYVNAGSIIRTSRS